MIFSTSPSLSPLAVTLTERAIPRRANAALTQLGLIVLGSLFVALLAQLEIRLPFTPVPISGQTLGVLLVGAALGSRRGAAAMALYLLEGAAGFPVFSGGATGITYLFGPTGGYLVGFIASAYVTGFFAERGLDRRGRTAWPAFLAGQSVVFLFGVPWLALFVGRHAAVASGLLPFIPGEIVKTLLAAGALPGAWRFIRDTL